MTPNLDNIRRFCDRLDHPENAFPSIHVTGTNGKGSVSAMLDAILRASGLKVGMYTSPHLVTFEERIRVNSRLISEEAVFEFLEDHWDFIGRYHCTFFEVATAMGLDYFRRSGVEVAVIEVGLGGTYDATRVVQSILSLVTRIDLDHTERLGKTREDIARDKAGIFRRGFPALCADQQIEVVHVLREEAERLGASLRYAADLIKITQTRLARNHLSAVISLLEQSDTSDVGRIICPLTGSFQIENLRLAIAAASLLRSKFPRINQVHIRAGLAQVAWPGRLQELSSNPRFILDVAHNPAAVLASLQNVQRIWKPRKIIAIFSALRDKDIGGMIAHLKSCAATVFIAPLAPPRGLNWEEIQSIPLHFRWNANVVPSVSIAVEESLSRAERGDVILALGSHYLAEEVLKSPKFN